MQTEAKPNPSRALKFGVIAWIPGMISSSIPNSVYGPPAQFNFGPGLAMLFFWGVGAIIALCGLFLCFDSPARLPPAKRALALLLVLSNLAFVAVSLFRQWV
jgi:hypothetical protein